MSSISGRAEAAIKYWIGSSGGNFASDSNWSTTSGGSNNTTKPGASDVATFDGGGNTHSSIISDISVAGINIVSGYTATLTQSGSSAITVGSSDWIQADGTFTGGSGSIDFNDAFTLSGGTFTATTGTLTIAGVWTHTAGGTFTHNSGTVTFDNAANKTHDVSTNETFYNVTVNTVGLFVVTITSGDTFIVTGTLTLTNGQANTGTLEAQGHVTVESTWDGGNAPLQFKGTNSQNFNLTGGEDTFNGGVTINKTSGTVTMNSTLTLNASGQDLTVTSGTLNMNGNNLTVIDDFTVNGGTFTGSTGTIDAHDTIISSGTLTSTSGTMTVSGAWTHTDGGTFTHNSGTVTFDNVANQTHDVSTSETFYNVTVNTVGLFVVAITSGDTFIVTGTLTLTNGQTNTGTLEAQGNVSVASTWDSGSSPLNFTGSATQTFDLTGGEALINTDIAVNKSGGAVNLASALTLDASSQDLTIQEGTFDLSSYTLTVNGTSGKLIIETGGNLQLQGSETITANTNYPQLDSGSTVTYDGTSGSVTIKDYTYHHLTINGSGGTFQMGAGETMGGNLTITAGTFDLNGNNLTVTSAFSNDGTIKLQGGETTVSLTMDTNSGTALYSGVSSYTSLKLGNTYYNLVFNGSGSWQHNATLDVNNNLNIVAGTLDSNSQNMTLAGNWTHTGTYTSGTNTVTLDGSNQTLAGTTTFYNLTKNVSSAATLTFPASTTITVANTLDLQGASGQLLSLRSSTTDTAFTINPQGTRTVQYLDVKDSTNSNATIVNCWTGCTNSNGNTSWSFAQPTVTLGVSGTPLAENGGTATYTATLSAASGATTTVNLSYSGTATLTSDYTRSGTSISISAGSSSGTATVTGANDSLDEEDETVIVDISSVTNGTESGTQQSTATITDDDAAPTVTIGLSSSTITEALASSTTLTATLSAVSERTVTVGLAFSGTATLTDDYTRSATSVSISAGSTTGTMSVTAVNDSLDENSETVILDLDTCTNCTESGTQQSTVTITDNDTAGVTVTESGGSTNTSEAGSTDSYTLVLNSQPTSSVTLTVSVNAQVLVNSSTVTFTTSNWSTSQTVTVSAVDDYLVEGNHTGSMTHSSSSSDTGYNILSISGVTVNITDNDTASITLTETGGATAVTEGGGTDTYTAVLGSQPTANVTITIADSASEVTLTASTLTFTSSNWNTAQTVLVTAIDDSDAEGTHSATVTHTVTSSDTNYSAMSVRSITVQVTDNDTVGVTVTSSLSSLSENAGTGSYTLKLTSRPSASVTVAVSADTQLSVSPATLTFTTTTWSATQTVTVTGVNDSVAQGTRNTTITHAATSSDASYHNFSISSVVISLTDNDTAGVTLVASNGSTAVVEGGATSGEATSGGATDSYTVVLTSQPTANVTVTPSTDSQLSVSPTSLSFTSTTWSVAQTVTVTAVADSSTEGNHASTITHTSASSDSNYQGRSIATITVTLTESSSTAPVAVAGSDRTMTAGNSITLDGSGSTGTSLSYQWSITSGDGALTNATTATPTFTASAAGGDVTFLVTITDSNGVTSEDTLVVSVIAEDQLDTQTLNELVVGYSQGGAALIETTNDTEVILTAGEVEITLSEEAQDQYALALTDVGNLVIGVQGESNNTGTVYISNETLENLSADINLANLSATTAQTLKALRSGDNGKPSAIVNADNSNFSLISGQSEGDQFGRYVAVGEINDDGEQEILVGAPGAGEHGIVYIYDLQANLIGIVLGSADSPISSVLSSAFLSADIDDLFFGPDNPEMNLNLQRHTDMTPSDRSFMVAGDADLAAVIDFSLIDADLFSEGDVSYQAAVFADVNGDGHLDLIETDTMGGAYLFLGTSSLSVTLNPADADVMIEGGEASDSFGQMVAAGDINGDGLADIVIGAPDAGSRGEGTVTIIFGMEDWPATLDINSSSSVLIVAGVSANDQIGGDLLLSDTDNDGKDEIYTLRGEDTVYRIGLALGVLPEGSTEANPSGQEGSAGGGDSLWGCELMPQATSTTATPWVNHPWVKHPWIILMACLSLIGVLRVQALRVKRSS